MHHRQMPAIADGVQSRRRLRQVLADDRRVANLPVTEAELEVGEADRPRIVGTLGRLEGSGKKGDPARGLATRRRQPAVHPPKIGRPRRVESFPRFGRAPERLDGLADVILQQPGVRQGAAKLDLLLTPKAWLLERPDEERGRLRATALIQCLKSLAV